LRSVRNLDTGRSKHGSLIESISSVGIDRCAPVDASAAAPGGRGAARFGHQPTARRCGGPRRRSRSRRAGRSPQRVEPHRRARRTRRRSPTGGSARAGPTPGSAQWTAMSPTWRTFPDSVSWSHHQPSGSTCANTTRCRRPGGGDLPQRVAGPDQPDPARIGRADPPSAPTGPRLPTRGRPH
jgi:hypothetical protein